jgi:uncharacterized protein with PQ loop repeat
MVNVSLLFIQPRRGNFLNAIGEICGFIGGAIGVGTALPQVLRIRKLGHTQGLALSPWVLMLIQFAAWSGFGVKAASPSILIANVLTFFTTALVVTAITKNDLKTWAVIVSAGALIGAFVIYGPALITDIALIALTASRLPQLAKSWLNRNSRTSTAVSISSLVVALVSMAFWMAYAVLTSSYLIVITTTVAICITLATALVENKVASTEKESK